MNISIEPTTQILNMGGPWVGTLQIDTQKYGGQFISQRIIIDDGIQMLFVTRYVDNGYFRWQIYFRIQAISLADGKIYLSNNKYKALCLDSASDGVLYFYETFCEGNKTILKSLVFNNDNFNPSS
jgi:hypothetical protein